MVKRIDDTELDARSRGEIERAKKLFSLFKTEAGKDQLYELLRAERYLRWLGVESVRDIIEQVHLERRKKECFNRGIEYDEDSASTHFVCPKNFDHHTSKYGVMPNSEVPRYFCRECNAAYSGLHNTILQGRGFDISQWYSFIDCMMTNASLEQTAKKCKISKNTALDWRRFLFYAVELLQTGIRLSGNIEADETYLKTNYAGKNRIAAEGVLRHSHKRGGETRQKDIQKDQVGIICAIDERGNCIARVAGIGIPTALRLSDAIGDAIPYGNVGYFITDGGKALARFAEMYHLDHLPLKNRYVDGRHYRPGIMWIDDTLYSEQHINAMHSNLNNYLRNFKGVSTRFLQGYLNLFTYKYSRGAAMFSPSAYLDILKMLVTPGHYLSRQQIEDKYKALVYSGIKNAKLADFTPEEIEMFARYKRGETREAICERLDCTEKDYDDAIKNIGADDHVSELAIAWFEREERRVAQEQERQRKKESRRERVQHILSLYRSGMTMEEVGVIYKISKQRIQRIIAKARADGEDISIHHRKRKARKVTRTLKKKSKKISKKGRICKRAEELQKQYPEKTITQIAQLIIDEFGPSIGNRNTVVTAISKMRMKKGEARKRRVIPKQTLDKIIVSFNSLIANGMTTDEALVKLSKQYKIKLPSLKANFHRNNIIAKRNIIPTETIVSEYITLSKNASVSHITKTQACQIIGEKFGLSPGAVSIRINRHFQKRQEPEPEFFHTRHIHQSPIPTDKIIEEYLSQMREQKINPHTRNTVIKKLADNFSVSYGYIRTILKPFREQLIKEWDKAHATAE